MSVLVESDNQRSCGTFNDEPTACRWLDEILNDSGLWNVYPEVRGWLLQPKANSDKKTMRIDRIITPRKKLIDMGFNLGAVGVEIKASGVKIGPAISQVLDYSRTAFELRSNHVCVWLQWVFIFPFNNPKCGLESVMSQNRIGVAVPSYRGGILFSSPTQTILEHDGSGNILSGPTMPDNGRKAGSR